jgi:hypothetical protein
MIEHKLLVLRLDYEYKLEEYEIRKEYENLLNFNISKFKSDIILNNINFEDLNVILIKNGVDKFLDFLNKKISVEKYIDNWFKIIMSNIKKILKKQENIIKEVIDDINKLKNYSTEYPLNEKVILNYNEYLKDNIKNNNM